MTSSIESVEEQNTAASTEPEAVVTKTPEEIAKEKRKAEEFILETQKEEEKLLLERKERERKQRIEESVERNAEKVRKQAAAKHNKRPLNKNKVQVAQAVQAQVQVQKQQVVPLKNKRLFIVMSQQNPKAVIKILKTVVIKAVEIKARKARKDAQQLLKRH